MKKTHRRILALCLLSFLPWALNAEAPVVDESDNFVVDSQYQADDQPLAKEPAHHDARHRNASDNDFDEQPLAHEAAHAPSDSNNAGLLTQVQSL